MTVDELISTLGYRDSPNFLTGDGLKHTLGLSHIFRRAKEKCSLHGVYTLKVKPQTAGETLVPLVYVCDVDDEANAQSVHRRVWNQNVVPFIIVQTPQHIRLYSGFCYDRLTPGRRGEERAGILRASIAFNQVARQLADFRAEAIDDGSLWREWEPRIDPLRRVDWRLLGQLERLGSWLRGNHLPKKVAHALIGKYVYLRYLRDRDILSNHKFEEWGLDPDAVFGRNATAWGLRQVVERLEDWLNGSIFSLELGGKSIGNHHVQGVARALRGDDLATGQQHLDFQAYEFSYIPIETLSVIYEQFLHAEGTGRGVGAYYTPVPLVDFMLQELEDHSPLQPGMRVFDGSCGSGAFLVQCYRRMVEKEFRKRDGERLKLGELRDLLVRHIYGMDRDEEACQVAEMSLILTMFDYINPPDLRTNPRFRIPVLHNTNIVHHDFFATDCPLSADRQDAQFDWIVGNPPWIEVGEDNEGGDENILAWIRANAKQFPTGGNQAAEAFAWRLSQFLSPTGVAGLLLPAMTLFKYESEEFRKQFFGRLRVWCVANFANLAEVLFAGRSRVPAAAFFYALANDREPEAVLTYAPFVANQEANRPANWKKRTPTWNIVVNAGEVRIISPQAAARGDQLTWKLAMWGSGRDERLLTRLRKKYVALERFAEERDIYVHQGLELRKQGSEGTEFVEELVGKDYLCMEALRRCGSIFSFPPQALMKIPRANANVRKGRAKLPLSVSRPPHIIVDAARRFAIFTDEFIGVPARQIGIAGSDKHRNLFKALSLFLASDFAIYFQFFVSPGWGVKRERATLQALKEIPIPFDGEFDFSAWVKLHEEFLSVPLHEEERAGVHDHQPLLFDEPEKAKEVEPRSLGELKKQLNEMTYAALGLGESERWLIEDLVNVRLALDEGRLAPEAVSAPPPDEIESYARALKTELDAFLGKGAKTTHNVRIVLDRQSGMLHLGLHKNGRVLVEKASRREADAFEQTRAALRREHSQWMYFDRNLLLFEGPDTYLFKPLQRFHWTRSRALADADQVIGQAIATPGE